MSFENLCVLVVWTKVAKAALEGLTRSFSPFTYRVYSLSNECGNISITERFFEKYFTESRFSHILQIILRYVSLSLKNFRPCTHSTV